MTDRRPMSPSILILSAHYGSGHIKVSEALEAAFVSADTGGVTVVDFFDMTSPRLNKFTQSLLRETTTKAPVLYGAFYRTMDAMKPGSLLGERLDTFGREILSEYLTENRPDIVICVYPTPAAVLSRMKSLDEYDGFVATVITDYRAHSHWIHPHVDLYLVAHDGLRDDLIARGISPARIAVTGIPVHPDFFRGPARPREGGDPQILVIVGGYSLRNAEKMARACSEVEVPANISIVCGRDAEMAEALTKKYAADGRVTVLGFVDNMHELMSSADVIVTKAGGITVSESLAKRLPMVIFRPVPGQEKENADFLSKAGAALTARGTDELRAAVRKLAGDEAVRESMKSAAGALFRAHPAETAAREILARFNERAANVGH